MERKSFIYADYCQNPTKWFSRNTRGDTSPVCLFFCLFVCLSAQLRHQRTLHRLPTPKIRGPVPQVLKEVVNLSWNFRNTNRNELNNFVRTAGSTFNVDTSAIERNGVDQNQVANLVQSGTQFVQRNPQIVQDGIKAVQNGVRNSGNGT